MTSSNVVLNGAAGYADSIASSVGGGGSGTSTPASETNAKYVTLLLNGDGTNGAQNQTFIDSSTNNATITRYGDATQGSFGPFGNSWGIKYVNNNAIRATHATNFKFLGSDSYTVEFWFKSATSVTTTTQTMVSLQAEGTDPAWGFAIKAGNKVKAYNGTSGDFLVGTTTITPNLWYHYAFVKNGTVCKVFLNGNLEATATNSIGSSALYFATGYLYGLGEFFTNGAISNLRMIKGTALYTTNFTPSSSPLTAVSGTVLLTAQSNYLVDKSLYNLPMLTISSGWAIVKDSPFPEVYDKTVQGASMYLDGSGDYLSLVNNGNVFNGGETNWTIELWAYRTVAANTSYVLLTSPTRDFYILVLSNGTLYVGDTKSNPIAVATAPNRNEWTHIAVTRDGTTTRAFLNGTLIGSSAVAMKATTGNLQVGYGSDGTFKGYISNLRIVKGTALYTANFTPPTAPLTAVANTSLLLKCDNAGIVDASGKNDLVTYGNAQVSTTQKKYGTGAMYFDGTGGYVQYLPAHDFMGDFTIELWIYSSTATGVRYLFSQCDSSRTTTTRSVRLLLSSATLSAMCVVGSTAKSVSQSGAIFANTWYHIAVVSYNGTLYLYKDGISVGTPIALGGLVNLSTNKMGIGCDGEYVAAEFHNGYIDDFRITAGVARYTTNFTPPTAPLTL